MYGGGDSSKLVSFPISRQWIEVNDANLIVLRVEGGCGGLREVPYLRAGDNTLMLRGRWQFRRGDQPAWSSLPLPARYGASPDFLFEP